MPQPAILIPEAMEALTAVENAAHHALMDMKLLALSRLRAGQINGCGPCVADSARRLRGHGATEDQVNTVAAWRETPWFSDEERATLALTEAVTRLADNPDPVPDEVWDMAAKHFDHRELAGLLLNIAVANAYHRLNLATRQQALGLPISPTVAQEG